MKKLMASYFILFATSIYAQSSERRPQLSLSAGSHLDFYQWQGVYGAPFNLQADLLFSGKNSVGLGYTYDAYKGGNTFFSARIRAGNTRHNLSIRYLHYLNEPQKIFSTYLGCSAGVSIWEPLYDSNFILRPTAQFIFGMRLKIYRGLFWMHEFGVGPTYIYQSSLGIRF